VSTRFSFLVDYSFQILFIRKVSKSELSGDKGVLIQKVVIMLAVLIYKDVRNDIVVIYKLNCGTAQPISNLLIVG